jgi:hypothetical protein
MNYLSRDFNYEYIISKVKLNWADIEYGVENKYISSDIAIDHAMRELAECEYYSQDLVDLASLSNGEIVYPYLGELSKGSKKLNDNIVIKEKWMYLILDWVYNNRNKYSDSLGIVEEIYSDFDYPDLISNFVRYMPSNEADLGSVQLNEARLLGIWYEYLDEQYKRFSDIG